MWGVRLDVNLKGDFVIVNKASLGIGYVLKSHTQKERNITDWQIQV